MASTHPTLRRKLLRDIARSWPLFAALTVTVLLGTALYAVANDSYRNLQSSYDNAFAVQRFPDLFVTGGDVSRFAADAAGDTDVTAVRTRVQADLPLAVTGDAGTDRLVGRVIGYPRTGAPQVAALTVLDGADNPGPGQVLVEEHMAGTFGLAPGDEVELTTAVGDVTAEVVGVVSSAEYLWPAPSRQEVIVAPESFGVVFATNADARTWSGGPDNQALVLLDSAAREADPQAALDRLRAAAVAADATEVLDREQQPSNALLQEDISGFQQMAVAFPALFLSAAALTLYVLLTRRVTAERQIIGTLRAQGVRRRTVTWHYLSYGLLAGVVGAAVGLPLGIALAGVVSQLYVGVIGLPEQLQAFSGFTAETVLVGVLFALGATGVAALFPARRAAAIPPAEAMRPELPQAMTGPSRIDSIPGLASAPLLWRMAARGIGRNTRRTIFTASGVALALILVLVSAGMVDTMNSLISVQFRTVSTADGQVEYGRAVTGAQQDAVRGVDGVTRVETVVDRQVSVRHSGAVYATRLTAFDPDTQMHGFIDDSGDPVALPDDAVLIDGSITAQLPQLQPGDGVVLEFADGQQVEAVVADFTYQPLGTFVYASKQWAQDNLADTAATAVLLQTADDVDPDAVRRAVTALPGVLGYVPTSALERTYEEFAGLFYAFVVAMLVLGGAMAFAIIFTTMTVNIVERQRELATLRAAGVPYRSIASLVSGENIATAALGLVPGIALGIVAAAAMLHTYSSDQFTLDLTMSPLTVVAAAAAIMVVAALSQWPGLRAVRRMDVAQVVRERAA